MKILCWASIAVLAAIVAPVAATEVTPVATYYSDIAAVSFAVLGCSATQIGLLVDNRFNIALLVSELIFAAIGGFFIHAVLMNQVEETRVVWATAALAGAMGSTFVRISAKKWLQQFGVSHFKSERDKEDNGK